MCGRFVLSSLDDKILEYFDISKVSDFKPHFNIAPSQKIYAISDRGKIASYQWGLIPSWAKDPKIGYKMINARSETVWEKPSFRTGMQKHRCLILANGFFEWKKEGLKKQPYFIYSPNSPTLLMAGLWDRWVSEEGEVIESATILTTHANEKMKNLHDRMPVILTKESAKEWLKADSTKIKLNEIIQDSHIVAVDYYPVETIVNSPKNDTPECIKALR